jgi:hypothetical protein
MTLREMKTHAWMTGIDWIAVEKQTILPPFIPDTSYLRSSVTAEEARVILTQDEAKFEISSSEQELFSGY